MAMNNNDTTPFSELKKNAMAALVVLLAIGFVGYRDSFVRS